MRNLEDFSSQSSRSLFEICGQTIFGVTKSFKNLDKMEPHLLALLGVQIIVLNALFRGLDLNSMKTYIFFLIFVA